jgi:hypothetical protein
LIQSTGVAGDGFRILFIGCETVGQHSPGVENQIVVRGFGGNSQSIPGDGDAGGRSFAAGLSGKGSGLANFFPEFIECFPQAHGRLSIEKSFQLFKAPRTRRPDAGDGHIHFLSDVVIAGFIDIEVQHLQKALATLRQLHQCAFDFELLFEQFDSRIDGGIKVFYRNLRLLGTQNRVCSAARYGNQPCRQSLFVAQLMEAAVEFQTDLLENVGSVFGPRTERTCHRVDQTLVAANKLLPSILFLPQTRLNYVVVWGIHSGNFNPRSIPDWREIGIRRQFRMYLPGVASYCRGFIIWICRLTPRRASVRALRFVPAVFVLRKDKADG